MYKKILDLHEKHYELWGSVEMKNRYGYVLSPSTFKLTKSMHEQLKEIGLLVADYQKGLILLNTHLAKNNPTEDVFMRRIFKGSLAGLPLLETSRGVPICKVDIMIDQNDNLFIAEIDGYNPRGLCYAVFLQDIQKQIGNNEKLFVGVMPTIIKYLEDIGSDTLEWMYSNRERYYEPVFKIFSKIMKETYNINVPIININELNLKMNSKPKSIIPWGASYETERNNIDILIENYKKNSKNFFFPLAPWMSTKAMFAFITDPSERSVYKDFFKNENYEKYLPKTIFVGRNMKPKIDEFISLHPECVLKQNISSGMKGVFFNDSEKFITKLSEATSIKSPQWTLQKKIDQKKFELSIFNENGDIENINDYIRICAYVTTDGKVVDAEVTGRPEPDVHGAPDCVMMPCTF